MKNILKIGLNLSLAIAALLFNTVATAQTVDLTNHEPNTATPGYSLNWYTDANHTSAVPDKTAVGAGLYYAFLVDNATSTCFLGPATLRVIENVCPANTVDITSAAPTTGIPTGATVTYHSALEPSSANEITGTATTEADAGTYYLAYRTGTMGNYCYSKGSPVVVNIKSCAKAQDDIAQTPQDTPVSGNVLTNDTNITKVTGVTVGGMTTQVPATGTVDVAVTGGTLTIASDGSYTFTPTPGFTGQVPTITYEGEDASGSKDTATLDIDVIANPETGNNAPVANDDTNTVKAGNAVTSNVLANDNDPDGDMLSIKPGSTTGLDNMGNPVALSTNSASPTTVYDANGNEAGTAYVNESTGEVVFTANAGYTGDVPFNYIAQDGNGGESPAKLTVTVTPADSPNSTAANDDASLGKEGEPQSGNVLTNDSDPEGDTQMVKEVKVLDANGMEVTVAAGTATDVYAKDANGNNVKAGSLTMNPDGTYSYTPEPGYVGTAPVKVVVEDNNGTPATDTSTLNLTTLPKTPVDAKNDIAQTTVNQPVSGNVLANDENLTKVTKVTIDGVDTMVPAGTAGATVNIPGKGSLLIKEDGSFTFTPAMDYTGEVPNITYTAENADGTSDTADLTVSISPIIDAGNNGPIANDDTNAVIAGNSVTSKVLANDNDIDGDALSIKPASTTGLDNMGNPVVLSTDSASPTTVYDANGNEAGTAYVNESTGDVVFNSNSGYTGDVPFNYTAQDGNGGESSATLTVSVNPTNSPNTTNANDDAALVEQGKTVMGNVLSNDTDPEGNTQMVREIKIINSMGQEETVPAGTATDVYALDANGNPVKAGSLTVNADGSYTYAAEASFEGTPPVQVVVEDNNSDQATANSALNLTSLKKSVALPIVLSSFEVVLKANHAELLWTTSSEVNNNKFEIERSIDAKLFSNIGSVKGQGNSSTLTNYSFDDIDLPNESIIYYRLKQIDFDGKYEYSNVIAVTRDIDTDIAIYPNPVVNNVIFISNVDAEHSYEIFDMLGKRVQQGRANTQIELSGLNNGTYLIRILDSNNHVKHVEKIVK